MYYTYALQGKTVDGKEQIYVGYTKDLEKRLVKHKSKSIKTTKRFKSLKLIYYEACLNKTDARKRELQLKTGFGRGYIKRRLKTYLGTRD